MSFQGPEIFSPAPTELGRINARDLQDLASVVGEIAAGHRDSDPQYLSPTTMRCEISPGGLVVLTHGIEYFRGDMQYTERPTTPDETRLILDAIEAFTAAAGKWLPEDEKVMVDYAHNYSLQECGYGDWHTDGAPTRDDFRGVLFYNDLPTNLAVGTLALPESHLRLLRSQEVFENLIRPTDAALRTGALEVVDGPDPLSALGITNASVHRVATVPGTKTGLTRTLVRLTTQRAISD